MSLLLAALVLSAAPPGWQQTEAAAGPGVYVASATHVTDYDADFFATLAASGRYRLASEGFAGRLYLEGGLAGLAPLVRDRASGGANAAARAGLAFDGVALSLGARASLSPTPAPVSLLPSARVAVRVGAWDVFAGLADEAVGPLARLGVEGEQFSLAFVPALGVEGTLRIPLAGPLMVQARAYAWRLFNAEFAGLDAALVWTGGAP